ncbi:unnamed protein product [Cylindrotheca closterium]|uniref:Uncharacterized protein n=1 Tax=Cylindrotheca closterium TaxID=2856 RepID=A0AAD2CFF2_9STRA|nr:unnamed protein product [Cylindrotheca closterium]
MKKKTTLNLLFLLKILTSPWTTLRNAHDKARDKLLQEDLILVDDLAKHPTTTHNARGELKFYLTRAKQKKIHVGLTASEFQKYRNYLEDKRMNKLVKLKKEEKKEKKKENLLLYEQRMKVAMAEKEEETKKQEEESPMSEDSQVVIKLY